MLRQQGYPKYCNDWGFGNMEWAQDFLIHSMLFFQQGSKYVSFAENAIPSMARAYRSWHDIPVLGFLAWDHLCMLEPVSACTRHDIITSWLPVPVLTSSPYNVCCILAIFACSAGVYHQRCHMCFTNLRELLYRSDPRSDAL